MAKHVTISTHCGSTVAMEHNRREASVIESEAHIDKNGKHESWVDRDLAEVYGEIFGDALAEYNQRVRPCRRIDDYLEAVKHDKRDIKPVYEMIVGVYPAKGVQVSESDQRTMLREYFEHWQERNPQLVVVGAYYHADEPKAQPHLHIDYVPVAHMDRGMSVQVRYGKALSQMGYTGQTIKEPLVKWTASENDVLQSICEAHGLYVDRPGRGNQSKHLSTAEYKRKMAQDAKETELEKEKQVLQKARLQIAEEQKALEARTRALEARERVLDERESNLTAKAKKVAWWREKGFATQCAICEALTDATEAISKYETVSRLPQRMAMDKSVRNLIKQKSTVQEIVDRHRLDDHDEFDL